MSRFRDITSNQTFWDNSESQNIKFKVKKILGKQVKKNQPQYLVKWTDYNSEENTWESEENLTHCFKKLH